MPRFLQEQRIRLEERHPQLLPQLPAVQVRTREDMRAAFEGTFRRARGRLHITVEEVLVNGTWAIERGRFSIHLIDRETGIEQVTRRRYLEVLVAAGRTVAHPAGPRQRAARTRRTVIPWGGYRG